MRLLCPYTSEIRAQLINSILKLKQKFDIDNSMPKIFMRFMYAKNAKNLYAKNFYASKRFMRKIFNIIYSIA
jgi:hypothetical protein